MKRGILGNGVGISGGGDLGFCHADDHEPSDDLAAFIDCQDKVYLICEHCPALWDGERWVG